MITVILTGAQGTGKTTILNEFRKKANWNVVTEVVRKLHKEGININEMGDVEGQHKIFDTYEKILSEATGNTISDRGLTDVLAYTSYMCYKNDTEENIECFTKQLEKMAKFTQEHPNTIYFYFPIEFDVVDDGVRSTDEVYRHEIDEMIKIALNECNIPYIEVRGTVEERMSIIEKALGELDEYIQK